MKINNYIFAIFVILLCSCVADDERLNSSTTDGHLYFDVSVVGKSTSTTKAQIVTPDNLDNFTKFGIYALDGTTCFFADKKVILDPDTLTWCSSESLPAWTYTDALIYGYAPYDSSSVTTSLDDNGSLVINYTHEPLFDDQVDLMVATPTTASSNSAIAINFEHALSAIAFNVEGYGNVKIKRVGFKNCYTKGTLTTQRDGTTAWSDRVAEGDDTYQMILYTNNVPTEGSSVLTSADGEYLMMIPSDDLSAVEFVALLGDVSTGEESIISLSLPTTEVWEASNIYTYNVTIEDLNNISFSREVTVQNWNESEDYDNEYSASTESAALEISNCYMLDSKLSDKVFYIPVSERIEEFWGGYEGYEGDDLRNYTLNFGDEWSVSYIWYSGDFTTDNIEEFTLEAINSGSLIDAVGRNERVTAATCTNNFLTQTCRAAIKITIPDSVVNGNVLVGVFKEIDGTNTLLWSWHLWVTDYNPNTVTPTSVDGSTLNFEVENGNIHRYTDSEDQVPAVWGAGGIYDGKYIMDRNIGAYSTNRVFGVSGDVLYYQYGRKDPYPAYSYNYSTATTVSTYGPRATYASGYSFYYTSTGSSGVTMAASVASPTRRYYSTANYSWLSDDVASNTDCVWNDVNVTNDIYANNTVRQKSMFDPSPLGWKIPLNEVWNNFPATMTMGDWSCTDTEADYYFNAVDRTTNEDGLQFTLYGYIPFASTGYFVYTASTYYHSSSSSSYGFYYNIYNKSYYYLSYLWSASCSTKVSADSRYLRVYGSTYGTGTTTGYGGLSTINRSSSMSIRCIQE
ncbi:MAG: fimbrillin family protein [Rikenellaceae bacterium]